MGRRSKELDFNQVRRLFRLIADAREIPPHGPERGQHLISGVGRIVGADIGGCVLDSAFEPGRRGAFTPLGLDGWDSAALATVTVVAEEGSAFHPCMYAMMKLNRPVVTATRQELVADRAWYASTFVDHYLRPAHLDHGLYSAIRPESNSTICHGLGFYRETGAPHFTDEDRNLVRLFHLECAQLLRGPGEAAQSKVGARLPPRQRQTLKLLLQGLPDKQIADCLGISPYTVNQYTKSIYRHYGVAGRAPLISKILAGRRD